MKKIMLVGFLILGIGSIGTVQAGSKKWNKCAKKSDKKYGYGDYDAVRVACRNDCNFTIIHDRPGLVPH